MSRDSYAPPTSTGPMSPLPAAAQEPAQHDLCCAHGEQILQRLDRLVELMETVAQARAVPQPPADGVYRVNIPAASRAQMRAEERMIQARLDAGDLDEVLADQALRRAVNEKIKAAADTALGDEGGRFGINATQHDPSLAYHFKPAEGVDTTNAE